MYYKFFKSAQTKNVYLNKELEVLNMCRYVKGMAAGMLVGAAIGMMMMPQFDRRTKRQIRKMGKRAMNMAGDAYGNMMNFRR
ncbi:YtxH domain-containing protein [Clostridium fallax]|nr:YtxH domain-containing protein [Clostridium fallax]